MFKLQKRWKEAIELYNEAKTFSAKNKILIAKAREIISAVRSLPSKIPEIEHNHKQYPRKDVKLF